MIGIFWSVLTPLGLAVIIGGVYAVVFRQPAAEFIPYLFSGLMPWTYLTACAEGGAYAHIAAEGYLRQTSTPPEVFPMRVALGAFINLIFSLTAFFLLYLILAPGAFSLSMLWTGPALLLWLMLGIGLANFASVINVFVRDFAPVQSLLLQGLFYVTPILYRPEMVAEVGFSWLFFYNPLYYFVEILRNSLLGDPTPGFIHWMIAGISAAAVFGASAWLLSRTAGKLVFKL